MSEELKDKPGYENIPVVKENPENAIDLIHNRPPVPGMEKFDAGDIIIPIIKLIQGTSDVKAGKPGQFINTTTNEVFDTVDLIMITYSKEMKVWQDDKGNDQEPKPQYKFLVLDAKNKWPMFLYVSGTSLWPAKAYLNGYWIAGIPLWYSITGLISQSKSNRAGLGKYYVMAFEAMRDTTEEERKFCYGFYNKYGKQMIDSKFEEDVDAASKVEDLDEEEVKIEDVPV